MEVASFSRRAPRSDQRAAERVLRSRGKSSNDKTESDTGLPPCACRFHAASKRSSASPAPLIRTWSRLEALDIALEVVAHLLDGSEGVRAGAAAHRPLPILVDDEVFVVQQVVL